MRNGITKVETPESGPTKRERERPQRRHQFHFHGRAPGGSAPPQPAKNATVYFSGLEYEEA